MKFLFPILLLGGLAGAQSSLAGAWSLQGTTGASQPALLSISLTPSSSTQGSGSGVTFIAIATFSDGSTANVTNSAIWSSSDSSIALVGSPGTQQNVSCLSAGNATIGAVVGSVSGTAALTCSAPSGGENAYCTGTTDATCFTGAQTDGPAALPTSGMETDMANTPAPGPVVTLTCGASLQTALNNLTAGQTLVVPAVCSGLQNILTGNFTLPVVAGADANHWNIIETDQAVSLTFPAEHVRATPCAINEAAVSGYPSYPCTTPAMLMPKLVCSSAGNQSCITPSAGAAFWRIIGLEIAQPDTFNNDGNGLVDLTNGADHIVIDRSLLHGVPQNCTRAGSTYTCVSHDIKNGVQLQNSTNVAVINSWLWDIACPQGTCTDAHAFGGGNGTLPSHTYKIYNNLVSAAGENLFEGGGGSSGASNIVTSTDFEVRGNYFFKPVAYALCTNCNGQHVEFKNLTEIKNAQRLLFEGNEFENSWGGWQTDQNGYSLVIAPRNQNISVFPTVTSDGAGNLTATSGSFSTGTSSPVSSLCAVAGHCRVTVGTTTATAQTQTDATHISVSPAPPAGSGIVANQCMPGENPNAISTDIVVRWNDFRNATNGVEVATVASDCGDLSLGVTRFTIHDNLFQGMNYALNNQIGGNVLSRCLFILNSERTPAAVTNYTAEHNTCIVANSGSYGNSGFDVTQDLTDSTSDGSTGSYLANMTLRNNIGSAGGIFTNTNGLYPGGAAAALKQMGCTPPVTGMTCSWTYSENVLGTGIWTNQTVNSPFPSSNQTCGNALSPGATCFPSGSAFTSLFTSYSGPNGQPGYLGNYILKPGGAYNNAGTDGLDVGISNWTTFSAKLAGVRSNPIYTTASVTTVSLPNATHGVTYSLQLAATSASDMQIWSVTSGSLPSGLSLNAAGLLSGTPSIAGTSTFTVQIMDAAQQYATRGLSLTVQ